MIRRISKAVRAGRVIIGGGNPVSVQSMTNKPAHDFEATLTQIKELEAAGADIVRLAVPDTECAGIFKIAKERGILCPLVADIHFDYKIALEAVRNGVDKVRINPGNIGERYKVREVADACRLAGIPIRIGVNGGSLDKKLLEKYGAPTADALAESALSEAEVLEDCGFSDIVISIKSSTVEETVAAAEKVASASAYPLHLGVTEAGDEYSGLIKNSAGIGSLLLRGIGDTIRVSLTTDPVREIYAGRELLSCLGLTEGGIEVVSCPTCGRTKIDLVRIAGEYKEAIRSLDPGKKRLKVAVMGCAVNGPGEAREADFGIAGGDGEALFFRKGEIVSKVDEDKIVEFLFDETKKALTLS